MTAPAGLEAAFRDSRRHLWGLCYRMTGSAADADDLIQDTFARAIERPPRRTDIPWKPWLVRVAMNLSRDHLRRRRRRGYDGPWLPAPVELEADEADSGGRYDLMESVSIAFLVALEALTPQKRAVLILRDVFDYSVAEAAAALDISQANVKTTLHRARRELGTYDRERPARDGLSERTGALLQEMFSRLAARDVDGFAALLADDVRSLSDGGGEFHAAKVPVLGRARVCKLMFGLLKLRGVPSRSRVIVANGLPALVAEFDDPRPHEASRTVMAIDIDDAGRITSIYSVLATPKMTAIAPLATTGA